MPQAAALLAQEKARAQQQQQHQHWCAEERRGLLRAQERDQSRDLCVCIVCVFAICNALILPLAFISDWCVCDCTLHSSNICHHHLSPIIFISVVPLALF